MKAVLLLLVCLSILGCGVGADHGSPHKVTWTPTSTADGYTLWCGTSTGVYTSNTNIGGGSTNELLLSLVPTVEGMNYCAMKAYNFAGISGYSNEIEFAMRGDDLLTLPPATPTGLGIT